MRKISVASTAFITLISLWISIATAQNCPVESTWINEVNSTLHIENIDSEGKITGYYINRDQRYSCQKTAYPVTGWVIEGTTAIAFTVKWENTFETCSSITAWTGYFSNDCGKLSTQWELIINDEIFSGKNTFTRVTQKQSDFIKK